MTMRRTLAALAALLLLLATTAACGDEETPDSGSTADPKVVEVSIEGDSVTPNGERIEVEVGQPIQLDITADEAGEIHVHSTPEQELEYDAGESTVTIAGIDQPGTVDVESHSLDKIVVQLEVS